jgi:hypothetical protein
LAAFACRTRPQTSNRGSAGCSPLRRRRYALELFGEPPVGERAIALGDRHSHDAQPRTRRREVAARIEVRPLRASAAGEWKVGCWLCGAVAVGAIAPPINERAVALDVKYDLCVISVRGQCCASLPCEVLDLVDFDDQLPVV